MQVNMNDNTSFGSFYFRQGVRGNSVWSINKEAVNLARGTLENIANDVDIQISSRNIFNQGFDILVTDPGASPLRRFFERLMLPKVTIRAIDIYSANSIVDLIIEKTTEAKKKFLESKG